MNKTIDSSAENFSAGNQEGNPPQIEAVNAMRNWEEHLKKNLFNVLLLSIATSFLVGYFICKRQEAEKRKQWAEIFFRHARNWLAERGRETAGSAGQGLEYARSAAERAANKGAKYSRLLNPFHTEVRRRFFGIG